MRKSKQSFSTVFQYGALIGTLASPVHAGEWVFQESDIDGEYGRLAYTSSYFAQNPNRQATFTISTNREVMLDVKLDPPTLQKLTAPTWVSWGRFLENDPGLIEITLPIMQPDAQWPICAEEWNTAFECSLECWNLITNEAMECAPDAMEGQGLHFRAHFLFFHWERFFADPVGYWQALNFAAPERDFYMDLTGMAEPICQYVMPPDHACHDSL